VKPHRFLEQAETEFHEAIAYLDSQADGLGNSFVDDVEAAIRRICEYPRSGPRISRSVRKHVLRKFRYNS